MKIRIIHSGKPYGGKVVDAETGEMLENVTGVKIDMMPMATVAVVSFRDPEIEIEGEMQALEPGKGVVNIDSAAEA